jgi:hypothetical protein
MTTQEGVSANASFQVLVIDMAHYGDDQGLLISGFPAKEDAIEYARRRLRDSIEELRKPKQTTEELRHLWLLYGEDALVVGEPSYKASDELDDFLPHPASASQRDWASFEKRFRSLIIKSSRQ